MSISVLSTVYEHVNRGGTARLLGVGTGQRYHAFRADDLHSLSMYRRISSASLYGSSDADPTLIFVDTNPFGFFDLGGFNGRFLQVRNAGTGERLVNLTDHGMNDKTSALLLAATARGTEFRVSFRDVFLSTWRSVLDDQLAGSGASRDGDPTLTWEMFPAGISYLKSSRTYLKIHQQLDIEIDWWPDYEASITYHIFLHVTDGNLRGGVHRWAYWVEGGAKSDDIAEELEPAVISGMNTLNDELSSRLSAFDGFGLDGVYYLPGRQTTAVDTVSGFTTDDVTIVLQL